MAEKLINKVIYGSEILIDLTEDTVSADKMLANATAHDKSGAVITGSISSKQAATYTPTTTPQTISSGQYLSGAQTIAGDSDLVAGNIKSGVDIFGVSGTFTADANATAPEILSGKTAYVTGNKVTGSMTHQGSVTGYISDKNTAYTVPKGYHDGGGKVNIATAEAAKIIAGNIKDGVTILGVLGTYTGEGVTAQSKEFTPLASYTTDQTVSPDTGYDYLSEVVVHPIPYTEILDSATGGYTVTIGASD